MGDLACTSHSSDKIKLLLGREFGDPDLDYVSAPMYCKKSASRTSTRLAVQLPSKLFKDEFENHIEPTTDREPDESQCNFDCEAWATNSVRAQSSLHWSRIKPCSLYVDGVQYVVRESFQGMYLRDLRTGIQNLLCIIRLRLS